MSDNVLNDDVDLVGEDLVVGGVLEAYEERRDVNSEESGSERWGNLMLACVSSIGSPSVERQD